jgi:hypothetical protein
MHVPKLIHQSWRDGGFPKTLFNWRWQQGLLDLNPGWRLVQWTDNSSRAFIAREYGWFLPTYDAYPSYIQRSDAARYFIVHHYGGVYADLDIECSRPFAPVLGDHRAVFSYKQGTNMSRGLVNALFASEARHPLWHTVFKLLQRRSDLGASAATHVDVVRSTGPGLLREALLTEAERSAGGSVARLERTHGLKLLDASVWHPIMPEQKRGRDTSSATAHALARSHCYHHFVSSWMTHDQEKHGHTAARRGGGGGNGGAGPNGEDATTRVPVGQGLRRSNTWRSYELASKPASDADEAVGDAGLTNSSWSSELEARRSNAVNVKPEQDEAHGDKRVVHAAKTWAKQAVAKRKSRRRRAGG